MALGYPANSVGASNVPMKVCHKFQRVSMIRIRFLCGHAEPGDVAKAAELTKHSCRLRPS